MYSLPMTMPMTADCCVTMRKSTAAENAESAEQLFIRETDRFDVLFSDVVLPGHSGIDLAKKLRQQNPRLAVLLSSGYTDERARWTAIEEEGFHFLQKPYPAATLLRAVRQVLDARPAPS
jgi:DNA-binding NtrC family response regulator